MIDHDTLVSSVGVVTLESAARRIVWTLGRPVQLADGAFWWLPQVETVLPLFRPELSTAIARSFCLADEVSRAGADPERQTLATAIYHSQLAQVALMLLQFNYELSDSTWYRLLDFDRLGEMLRLTLAVSEEIIETFPTWMPFILTGGPDGSEILLSN